MTYVTARHICRDLRQEMQGMLATVLRHAPESYSPSRTLVLRECDFR